MTVDSLTELPVDAQQFVERWHQPPNFRLSSNMLRTSFAFPDALEVLERVRADPATRVTVLGSADTATRTARAMAFRRAPLEEVATWPFRLVHFDLRCFYDDFLRDFQEQVMIPWRVFLARSGFTWHRCYPVLFMSTAGCSSTYHVDSSNGLVWQIHGVKTFHSFLDPQRHAPVQAAVRGEIAAEDSPPHADSERLSLRMEPGDLVWSHALTPHWVTAESALTLSMNISHGGLARSGRFSGREHELRRHWDDFPALPWQSDLRNIRY